MEKKMFINFTNHPSSNWGEKQKNAAQVYGEIKDILFPEISPQASEEEIEELAEQYVEDIVKENPSAVLCQGEYTFVYQVVQKLKEKNIIVLAACSKRNVVEVDNKRIVEFQFEQFRKY